MKTTLTIIALIFIPLGMIFGIIKLAIHMNMAWSYIISLGAIAFIALAAGEIYEKSK